ncbi:ABC transporter substrate-binding protein [Nocardiopsis composta]|uniref:NitT/TauT family transport system substrate-binding protein n=1 Tax=Nocardiopsis composta TaxID=157465 RepID=A0A7W8QKD8_9ACTN|nr:ABC transporter substrate-binding protein [Nocardiopsis composta]MBB5432082.1 NitT/TauT family transport system substrate-binding protein [Nocardiopsis composta]
MPRRLLAGACAALLAVAASACGGSDTETTEDGLTKITVGAIPIVDVAPLHLGIDQGYFETQGLEVEVKNTSGGAQAVPGAVSGEFDFAFGNVTSLLVARDSGLPVQTVANGVSSTGKDGEDFGAIVVPEGSDIKSPKDLAGAKVAVNNLKNIGDTTVRNSVREDGGDPSNIQFTELPFPDMPAALEKEEVDAAWVVEPFLTTALDEGATEIASNFVDAHEQLTVAVYFTTEENAKKDPELVEKFVTAMNHSLSYAESNPEEVRRILGTYTEMDEQLIEDIRLPAFPPDSSIESVQAVGDMMKEDGLIKEDPQVDALFPGRS